MTDRELLEKLYDACLNVTRCLGDSKGYLPQLGYPRTRKLVEAVMETRKHLDNKRHVFNKIQSELTQEEKEAERKVTSNQPADNATWFAERPHTTHPPYRQD